MDQHPNKHGGRKKVHHIHEGRMGDDCEEACEHEAQGDHQPVQPPKIDLLRDQQDAEYNELEDREVEAQVLSVEQQDKDHRGAKHRRKRPFGEALGRFSFGGIDG